MSARVKIRKDRLYAADVAGVGRFGPAVILNPDLSPKCREAGGDSFHIFRRRDAFLFSSLLDFLAVLVHPC